MEATPLPFRGEAPLSGISIILPSFNEERQIANTIGRVRGTLGRDQYEIIVVDDGSRDQTREKALAASVNNDVKVLSYARNMGKGFALKFALKYALGEYLIFMDSDSDIDSSNLHEYVSSLAAADVVIASKRHRRSVVEQPVMRRVLSLGFNVIVRLLTGIRSSDTQSGLKALRASAARKIVPLLSVKRYAFDVELLTVAQMLKLKVVELPVRMKLEASFEPKDIVRILVDLAGIVYRYRIIRWYQANLNRSGALYEPLLKI